MKSRLHYGSNGPRTNLVCVVNITDITAPMIPTRVARDKAARLVAKGTHAYCKKTFWRESLKADD